MPLIVGKETFLELDLSVSCLPAGRSQHVQCQAGSLGAPAKLAHHKTEGVRTAPHRLPARAEQKVLALGAAGAEQRGPFRDKPSPRARIYEVGLFSF